MKMSKEEREKEFRTKFGLTENGFIILDLLKVQIPEELLENGREFVYPLDGFTGSSNMPKPPMQSSAGNYIKINAGNIYVSVKGKICVYPYRFDEFCERSGGVENAIKTIRKDIENLPKLFQWALEIRKEQDRMFAQICAMLPGWKIRGLEGMKYNRNEEYLRNNFWKHGKYSHGEIRSWVEFLKNNGVDLTPPEKQISLEDVAYYLYCLWYQTEGQKKKREKELKEARKKDKNYFKNLRRKFKKDVVKTAAILKANGLLN